MFSRDNVIGFVFLGICVVVAAIMLRYIATGTTPSFSAPGPIGAILTVAFFGVVIFGFLRSPFGRRLRGDRTGGGTQWPNPHTGQRSWWDRLRGR